MDHGHLIIDRSGHVLGLAPALAARLQGRKLGDPLRLSALLSAADLRRLQALLAETPTRSRQWLSEAPGPLVGEDWLLRLSNEIEGRSWRLELVDLGAPLREQRRRVRLGSVWDMAAGIAHEFNNRLTAALGNSFRLRARLGRDPAALPALERLEDALLGMDRLTGQLLQFTALGGQEPVALDLTAWLLAQRGAIEARLPAAVPIEYDWADAALPVLLDGQALGDCLLALVDNALEAMPGRGRLWLRAERMDNEAVQRLRPHWLEPEAPAYACIRLRDDGSGIAPDLLERAVEPFVSSRQPGRGLGLSVVLGVLQRHNGGMHLHRCEPKGTEAMLFLPLLEEPLAVGVTRAQHEPSD